jgi:hypothetical protein
LFVSTAVELTCLATRTGWRTGSFRTKVTKRIRSVTLPSAGMREKGSKKGLPSRNSLVPSGLKG